MDTFSSPYGEYHLDRYPPTDDKNLFAWDSADRYILETLAELPSKPGGPVVICNDEFGALTTALNESKPLVCNDSALSHQAISNNFELNHLNHSWTAVPSTELPSVEGQTLGLVIIKVPKSLSYLENQLAQLAPLVSSKTVVIGAGKVKHIHTSTLELFERYIGATTTSLAKQKSRLIFCTPTEGSPILNPWPQTYSYEGREVLGHANVFSHRKLDIGTRFLLEQLNLKKWAEEASSVIDLGCGNGLVGLAAIKQNQELNCTFTDRSYMAVESARHNVAQWFPTHTQHQFILSDSLTKIDDITQLVVKPGSSDLALCNPPFHDNHVMGQQTATKMFRSAVQALTPDGKLIVVANRHLQYHHILKRMFTSCELAGSNRKFVITVAQGPRKIS